MSESRNDFSFPPEGAFVRLGSMAAIGAVMGLGLIVLGIVLGWRRLTDPILRRK